MAIPVLVSPIGAAADYLSTEADFTVGERAKGKDGSEFVYVQANGAISANDVVIIDEDWQADQIDTTNSAGALGDKVGVARAAFADNEYGWVQVHGVCDAINVGTSAAANTKLNTTATAGRIDDDATAGAETIAGLYTTGAESGNAAAGVLHYPFIDATL